MIDNISKFFDNNPLYGILTVIFVAVILWCVLNNKSNCCSVKMEEKEHLTLISSTTHSIPKCTSSIDTKFNASYVGPTKLINFKTTIDGKEYYLANMKIQECVTKEPEDCANVVMVLIEKSDIESMMQTYVKNLAIAKETCNASKKITCEHSLPANPAPQDIQKCNIPDISCNQTRKFYHDFNVIELIDQTSASLMRKYIIKGTAVPNINDNSYPTMFNQSLFDEKNVNLLCGDAYNYGQPNLSKGNAELMIIEKDIMNNGGIIRGTGNQISVKLRFDTRDQIISHDSNGKQTLTPIMDQDGKTKKIGSYVGICKNKTCKLENGKSYQRVCLYTDILDPNVLEFEPILVDS